MTSMSAAGPGTRPDAEISVAGHAALARQARAISDQMAAAAVRAIAASVRAELPAAAAAGLAWTGRGPSLEPAGFFTAAGERLGAEPGDDQAAAARLTGRIRGWCASLNQANQAIWGPLTTGQAVSGTTLDGEYLLDVGRVLAGDVPAVTCGCPPGARAVTAGITVIGHQDRCTLAREPLEYVWRDGDQVRAGTLARYAADFEVTHDDSLPGGDLSPVIRAWDAGYSACTVQAACLDDSPDEDGCWLVRLSVPGEEVTARVWALSQPFPLVRSGELPAEADHGPRITLTYWVSCRFTAVVPAAAAARALRNAGRDQAAAIATRIAAGETVTGDPAGTRASYADDTELRVLAREIETNFAWFQHDVSARYAPDEPDDAGEAGNLTLSLTVPGPAGEAAAR